MSEIALATLLLIVLVLALTALVMTARAVLLPSGPVAITINANTQIIGTTGEKLLTILNDAGIAVPSACAGAGTCGLCKVRILRGGGEVLPTEMGRLPRQEIKLGMRLACQLVVRDPLSVDVPEDILAAGSWECMVVSNIMLAPLIKEVVLKLPEDREFAFRAGSFVQVTAPAYSLDFADIDIAERHEQAWQRFGWRALGVKNTTPVSRAYSIANTPADTGYVVLNIRLAVPPPGAEEGTPPGLVSSFLFGLNPGDIVNLSGPFGEFQVQDTDREMVFIGGGVGMAPLRAMIFDQLERVGTGRKISFWYGARTGADLFYAEAFDQLAQRHENFDWRVALSNPTPDDNGTGKTGFIHDVVFEAYLKDHPTPEACEYYLCGPPLMIDAVIAMLADIGVEDDAIFNDDFGG